MVSMLDVNTLDIKSLAEQLKLKAGKGFIDLKIPKKGVSEREDPYRDYLQAAYCFFLMSKFDFGGMNIPAPSEKFSFTFRLITEESSEFYYRLAETLILISAGYENEMYHGEGSLEFYKKAKEFYHDWKAGRVKTNDVLLKECEDLMR